MAKYQKQNNVSGNWVKNGEITNGVKAKLVSETTPTASQFKNEDGTAKTQDVAKIRFENLKEAMNISINRPTLNGLIEAFGEDSKNWINKYLTVQTEKMVVGGKRVTALYLIPNGFELKEDENGYMVIKKIQLTSTGEPIPFADDEIVAEDLPF